MNYINVFNSTLMNSHAGAANVKPVLPTSITDPEGENGCVAKGASINVYAGSRLYLAGDLTARPR
jgi:hypothetical protein